MTLYKKKIFFLGTMSRQEVAVLSPKNSTQWHYGPES